VIDEEELREGVLRTTVRSLFGAPVSGREEQADRTTHVAHRPVDLAEICAVDVVLLHPFKTEDTSGFRGGYRVLKETHLTGMEAQKMVLLWRHLVPSENWLRCHSPAYGLRFHTEQGQCFEATICWQCRNIVVESAVGASETIGFEAHTTTAQELLYCCLKSARWHPYSFFLWNFWVLEKVVHQVVSLFWK
jgi:hypothetical protein